MNLQSTFAIKNNAFWYVMAAMMEKLDAAVAHCVDDVRRSCDYRLQACQDRAAVLKEVLLLAPADFPAPSNVFVGDILSRRGMYATASWRAGKCDLTLTCERDTLFGVASFSVNVKAYDGGEFSDETYDVFCKTITYDNDNVPQRVFDLVRQQMDACTH